MMMNRGSKLGSKLLRPSAALSTEMAGVITPSPYSSAAPNRIRRVSGPIPPFNGLCSTALSASSAKIPPSPRLSARVTKLRYLTPTSKHRAQKISESAPRILSVGSTECRLATHSRSAYSGLVPMSPKTTPKAPSVSASCAARAGGGIGSGELMSGRCSAISEGRPSSFWRPGRVDRGLPRGSRDHGFLFWFAKAAATETKSPHEGQKSPVALRQDLP